MERILISLKNKKKNNLLNFTSCYTQSRSFNEKRNNLINEFKQVHSPIKEYVYNKISEAEGLEKAYAHGDYFIHGKTMYIAGSHTKKDWYDDVTKVPDWGDLRQSTRYQAAEKALKENPQVTHVVGHSLGGSVALQLKNITQTKSKHVELTALLYWMIGKATILNDIDIAVTPVLFLIGLHICLSK